MIALTDSKNAYVYAATLDLRIPGRPKDYYILKLVKKVGKYRTIVIDRGYVTLSLVENLFLKGYYLVGTIKRYRNIPQEILNFKMNTSTYRRQRDRSKACEESHDESAPTEVK
jgi:hypothetical protein